MCKLMQKAADINMTSRRVAMTTMTMMTPLATTADTCPLSCQRQQSRTNQQPENQVAEGRGLKTSTLPVRGRNQTGSRRNRKWRTAADT